MFSFMKAVPLYGLLFLNKDTAQHLHMKNAHVQLNV
jgi:hypothetical protein